MQKSKVVRYFGSATKVADFLGISTAAISQWSDFIPEKFASRLGRMTCGVRRNGVKLKYKIKDYSSTDLSESSSNKNQEQQPERNLSKYNSSFISKLGLAEELGFKVTTITSWQHRYWRKGFHYAVIGRTTLIYRDRVEAWLGDHFQYGEVPTVGRLGSRVTAKHFRT